MYMKDKSNNYFDSKNTIVGKHLDLYDQQHFEFVVNRYASIFYAGLVKYNELIDIDDLKKYAVLFVKDLCIKRSKSDYDIRPLLLNEINRDLKRYENDVEYLFKRYIILVGVNDKILDFYVNKYYYLLERYKNTGLYKTIKGNFRSIVKFNLSRIVSVQQSLLKTLQPSLHKFYLKEKQKKNHSIQNIKTSDKKAIMRLHLDYSYIQLLIFNIYKNKLKISDEQLKKLISQKYDDYLYAYINGSCKSEISKYITYRLKEYFDRTEARERFSPEGKENGETLMISEKQIKKHEYYVDKFANLFSGYYPNDKLKDKIKDMYLKFSYMYYEFRRQTVFSNYVYSKLDYEVKKMSKKYSDDGIAKFSSKIRYGAVDSRAINSEIADDLFSGWVNVYLNSDIHEELTFEEFMIKNLITYNEDDYKNILNVKANVKCKVLNKR